ncbi:beta-xylosidase [Paenibacillus montaniterrae]|uniref:Beta-xylosidase n=1 Tax=Paenibacillus montaniterrae TaxID=429341 RepID=A0A919YL76_9BACL|nr:glycoside hydrolase family 43 protein [Paenibacillus montaniterrae]GIP15928.1 beta-xylosidase [Paenibacillus montaniterrae]
MALIQNPILRGFNPDPSIIRVGDDYYIATSTFEWFPGVQIHHSKDLIHWQLIGHPLTRASQLNMIGNPDSGGVWAPCLSYSNGIFYLVYTDVKSHMGQYKDTHNYVVTATSIEGPWSEPVYLNSSGFDPSLYHDEDGSKWLVNLKWDHRKGKNPFGGIIIQQYDEQQQNLVGDIHLIYDGTELGLTEGPHIYKHEGYYYLLVAEGGTRYGHAETVARSRTLLGKYETDPNGPLLTSRYAPDHPLQRAGHASLVQTQNGSWYIAHLCGRPVTAEGHCILGRETAIQCVEWTEEGWLRLSHGEQTPALEVEAPELPGWQTADSKHFLDHFTEQDWSVHWSSLREPITEAWASKSARPGWLRLYGRESLYSQHRQSLIARRQQAFHIEAETKLDYAPDSYQQMAGLIYYYNTKNYYYLFVSWDEQKGKCLGIISSDRGVYDEPLSETIALPEGETYLKAVVLRDKLQFYYSLDGEQWQQVGNALDASIISDEHAELVKDGIMLDQGFTGAFIGLCAQDLGGTRKQADFDYFKYEERD